MNATTVREIIKESFTPLIKEGETVTKTNLMSRVKLSGLTDEKLVQRALDAFTGVHFTSVIRTFAGTIRVM